MRYTVNRGSAKEPEAVEMVHVGPHEAVHADFVVATGLREWEPEIAASGRRKGGKRL